jgi:hypothetical protein
LPISWAPRPKPLKKPVRGKLRLLSPQFNLFGNSGVALEIAMVKQAQYTGLKRTLFLKIAQNNKKTLDVTVSLG